MSAWQKLSAVDVSSHTEKKGQLTYLSWAWAWGTLVEHYPDANYEFTDNEQHGDGSVTVHVALTVDGITRKMWLPVMDNRNKAIQNPSARDISDAKMRCLVKAIAMFGLGHYIYAGEDLPSAVEPRQSNPATYDNAKFHENLPAWEQAFADGKITKEGLITRIESKAALTDAQRANIMGLGEHA